MLENNEKVDQFLSYVSDMQNKAIILYDLINTRPKPDAARISLYLSEANTSYHAASVFYYSNSELAKANVVPYFTTFEEVYLELKQHFLHKEDKLGPLVRKMEMMKDFHEELTNQFNVL